jgi:hypothetical protein
MRGKMTGTMRNTLWCLVLWMGAARGAHADVLDHIDTNGDQELAPTPAPTPAQTAAPTTTGPGALLAQLPPAARTPVMIGGAVAAGVGVLGIAGGVTPAVLYSLKQSELTNLRDVYRAAPSSDQLANARTLQADAAGLRDGYHNVGIWVAWTSLVVGVVGGGAAIVAATLWPVEET